MASVVSGSVLQTNGIIPDLLPESLSSSSFLILPMKFGESEVHLGKELTPTITTPPPQIQFPPDLPNASPESLYCILCLDLDPPSRRKPRFRSILHLMQINIPGNSTQLSNSGITHAEYGPPGPPKSGGKHRYVFLLYRQTGSIDATKLPQYTFRNRGKQQIDSLLKLLNESGGGSMELIAVNWFEAQWDEQVNRWMKEQFGWKAIPLGWIAWMLT